MMAFSHTPILHAHICCQRIGVSSISSLVCVLQDTRIVGKLVEHLRRRKGDDLRGVGAGEERGKLAQTEPTE